MIYKYLSKDIRQKVKDSIALLSAIYTYCYNENKEALEELKYLLELYEEIGIISIGLKTDEVSLTHMTILKMLDKNISENTKSDIYEMVKNKENNELIKILMNSL